MRSVFLAQSHGLSIIRSTVLDQSRRLRSSKRKDPEEKNIYLDIKSARSNCTETILSLGLDRAILIYKVNDKKKIIIVVFMNLPYKALRPLAT